MKTAFQSMIQKITSFTWLRSYVNYLFYSSFLLIPFSFLFLSDSDVILQVHSKSAVESHFTPIKPMVSVSPSRIFELKVQNAPILDRILLSTLNFQVSPLDIFNLISVILILWQLKTMLTKMKLHTPFQFPIHKTLRNITWIIFVTMVIEILRHQYAFYLVETSTSGRYQYAVNVFVQVNMIVRGCLLLFFIATLLKKGYELQQEQDLTI